MLILAHASMPGRIEAATVDHGLRPEAAAEAQMVADFCAALGVPHRILRVVVPGGNIQDAARIARYAALADWMAQRGLGALATAHHADDQAETLLMRLNRGSGVAGLAGVRALGTVPGSHFALIRPLLDWRRAQLGGIIADTDTPAAQDPSNKDERFDRVRMRGELAGADWIDAGALAGSAKHLADADTALEWAGLREWDECVTQDEIRMHYCPSAPRAIRLRVVARIIAQLGGAAPRGGAAARLIDALEAGQAGSLGGVIARVENDGWIFEPEPPRCN